jgi:hypothetical protein
MVPVSYLIGSWVIRWRLRQAEAKLDVLGRRLGLLQMGSAASLFDAQPPLSKMVDGGVGLRKAFAAMRTAIAGGSPLNLKMMLTVIEEGEEFMAEAHYYLNESEKEQPRRERLFQVRPGVKSMF